MLCVMAGTDWGLASGQSCLGGEERATGSHGGGGRKGLWAPGKCEMYGKAWGFGREKASGCRCNCKHAVQGSVDVLGSLEQWVLAQVQNKEPTDTKGLA